MLSLLLSPTSRAAFPLVFQQLGMAEALADARVIKMTCSFELQLFGSFSQMVKKLLSMSHFWLAEHSLFPSLPGKMQRVCFFSLFEAQLFFVQKQPSYFLFPSKLYLLMSVFPSNVFL